jgi:hypothetical protein
MSVSWHGYLFARAGLFSVAAVTCPTGTRRSCMGVRWNSYGGLLSTESACSRKEKHKTNNGND